MAMHAEICYMMEALTYFGIKANNVNFEQRMNKALLSAGNSAEAKHFIPASRMAFERLESMVHVDDGLLKQLFGFFSGMPDGHPCGYNIASLLCFDAANKRLGYEEQKALIRTCSRTERAKCALMALGIFSNEMEDSFDFFGLVDRLPLSQEDKLRIMTVCTHPEDYIDKVFSLLDIAAAALRACEAELLPLIDEFCTRYVVTNITDRLNADGGFILPEDAKLEAMPYLLNPGVLTVFDSEDDGFTVHIGMLYLSRFIGNPRLNDAETLETLKSISDSSRLAILRCLGNGEMYGQEIAKQVGLYSTTISHHMAKLINCRIVRCRLAGNKAYYSIDKDGAQEFVNGICDLLKTKPSVDPV